MDLSSLQDDADADPDNEIQSVSFDTGTRELAITGGNSVVIPDADTDTDDQQIAWDVRLRELTIDDGNTVVIPDADEQALAFDPGTRTLSISNANAVTIPDADAQTLTFDGSTGSLSSSAGNSVALPVYRRTLLISPTGTAVQNGTALRNAVAAISGPSATNQWLVKIEPGIYDFGTQGLQMRSFVDVEGSGMGVTTLTSTVSSFTVGTVTMATDSELRNLTVQNTGGSGNDATAVRNGSGVVSRIRDLRIVSTNATGFRAFAIEVESSTLTARNIEVSASGGTAANNGIWGFGGTITVHDSVLSSTGSAFLDANAASTFRIIGTRLIGAVTDGNPACVGSYNASFVALGAACN